MLFKLFGLYARETWSSRTLAFFCAMLLLTGFLLWGLPAMQGGKPQVFSAVNISVVDDDRSFISYTLIDQFSSLSMVGAVYVDTLAEAQRRLDHNEVLLILVIPAEFYEQSMRSEKRSPLTVYLNERMPAETAIFVRLLHNAADSIVAIQSAYFAFQDGMRPLYADDPSYIEALDVAFTNLAFQLIGRKSILATESAGKMNTVIFVISSMTCLLAMLTGLLVLLQVQQDRRSGLHERLLAANVPWWQLILARQLTGLVWLAAGFAPLLAGLFLYYPAASKFAVLLAVLILYWISGLFCQFLGYLGQPGESMLLGAWLGLLALMLLGGCIYPRPLLPAGLQVIGLLSPAHWARQVLYDALAGRPSAAAMPILAAALLLAVATLAVYFSWRRARPGQ